MAPPATPVTSPQLLRLVRRFTNRFRGNAARAADRVKSIRCSGQRGRTASRKPACTPAAKLLSQRILLEYSLSYECSVDTAWPARAGPEPRIRPETGLRRVLRPRQAAALQPGVRDPVPAGQGRKGGPRTRRAGGRARTPAVRHHRGGRRRCGAVAGRAGPAGAGPNQRAVRQGGARPDAGTVYRGLAKYAAGGPPSTDVGALRGEAPRRSP